MGSLDRQNHHIIHPYGLYKRQWPLSSKKKSIEWLSDLQEVEQQGDEKYPILDTSTVLENLGKSKHFTMLDLTPGFHQALNV